MATQQQKKVTSRWSDLSAGFALPFKAVAVLLQNQGVKRFAILPLLLNVMLYLLVLVLCFSLLNHWDPQVGPWSFWGGSWMADALNWSFSVMKWVLGIPLIMIAGYFSFTAVGMVVASPLNDILSERVERTLVAAGAEGDGAGFSLRFFLRSLKFSIWIAMQQIFFSVLALPFILIPVLGFIPLLCVTAYFSGLGFTDTSMSRANFLGSRKREFVRQHVWKIFGMGLAMELLFYVPLVGLLVLPLGVTAGTLLFYEIEGPAASAADGSGQSVEALALKARVEN